MARDKDDGDPGSVPALERELGRRLYSDELRAIAQGHDIRARAREITRHEQRLGRRLYRRELREIMHGEWLLPSAVSGETWIAHPMRQSKGPIHVVQGGAPDSSRRRH